MKIGGVANLATLLGGLTELYLSFNHVHNLVTLPQGLQTLKLSKNTFTGSGRFTPMGVSWFLTPQLKMCGAHDDRTFECSTGVWNCTN